MGLRLIKLTKEYKDELIAMIEEWKADQALNNTDRSPWAIFRNDCHDFDYYLEHLENKSTTGGWVPDSVFFLLDEERGRLLGAVDIRHYLNDALTVTGGHVGDGVRPSERRKGYGTEMVRLALIECKKLGANIIIPPMWCCTDNAAMIAKVAEHLYEMKVFAGLDLGVDPNWSIENWNNYQN